MSLKDAWVGTMGFGLVELEELTRSLEDFVEWTSGPTRRRQSANMQKTPWRNVTCTKWWKSDTTRRSRTEEVDDLKKEVQLKRCCVQDEHRRLNANMMGSRPSPIGLVARVQGGPNGDSGTNLQTSRERVWCHGEWTMFYKDVRDGCFIVALRKWAR